MRTDMEGKCCVFYDIGADAVLSVYKKTHYPTTKQPRTRGIFIPKRTIETVIEGVRGYGYRRSDSAKGIA